MKYIDLNNIVVFDCETTGLDPEHDEILQLSIIDGNCNVLFSSFIKPLEKKTWEAAQAIHGISPDDVADAPAPCEVIDQIQKIFNDHKLHIAYNGCFDKNFLYKWGIDFGSAVYYDVMLAFAPIYGEWNDYYGEYKWQKLIKCAAYYNYEFKAHDALEDVKATLHCFQKMMENDSSEENKIYNWMHGLL